MMDFDPWAVDLTGTQLIEASAGTGKTYTLTTLYLRLLVEKDLLPSEILVVTYTHAATAELRDRVRGRIRSAITIGEQAESAEADSASEPELLRLAQKARAMGEEGERVDPLRRALQSFDEASIFTIHGFCQRTLQENAFESGMAFESELIEDAEALQRTLAHDLWSRLLKDEGPEFVEWLRYGAGRRWDFEPEALERSILRVLGSDEEMPILPAKLKKEAKDRLEILQATAEKAWVRWASSWQQRRDTVSALLLGENDLSGNRYRVATIQSKWFPQLDAWQTAISAAGEAGFMNAVELPDWWKNLVPEGLTSGLNKNGRPVEDVFFVVCAALKDAVQALDETRRNHALSLRLRFVAEAREQARERREQKHLLFFDDLLCELRRALRPPGGDRLADLLRDRYRYALIDEFQDTDPVQYEIFRRVWHDANDARATGDHPQDKGLFLVGDPKQAIYGFRGADVFTYLLARKDAQQELHGLQVNWRSRPELIAAVNALFEQPERPFGLDSIEFHPVAARPDVSSSFTIPDRSVAGLRVLMADRSAAVDVKLADKEVKKPLPLRFGRTTLMQAFAKDVADLLDAGGEIDGRPIRPSDVAVLCRRKSELAAARRALENLGIPCVDRGDSDVFDTREAWELLSVLQAWMHSSDPVILRSALSTAAHGLDAQAIRDLSDDHQTLASVAERYADYKRIWTGSGFGLAFESWRRQERVTEQLLGFQDGERRLTNWLHLAEILQKVEHDLSISKLGLVAWLERAIAASDARVDAGSEASLLRLERDDEAVSLLTMHRSKGLEFEIVYLPCLWEKAAGKAASIKSAKDVTKARPPIRFYDERTEKRTLDLGGPDYAVHVEREEQEALSERFRMLYVALTRAKQQCVVLWGAIGTEFHKTPLAWLLHAREWESQGEDPKNSPTELGTWSDEQWRSAWGAISQSAEESVPNAISIEAACIETRARWRAPLTQASPLEFHPRQRVLGHPVMTTSFSGLVRDAHRSVEWLAGPRVTGRDREDHSAKEGLSPIEGMPDLAASMHEFPRGAQAGTLLHDVLERVDYSVCDRKQIEALARQAVERGGLKGEPEALVAQIVHVVFAVAETPLRAAPDRFCLADLPSGQQRPEIEFTLAALGDRRSGNFSPASLSTVLAQACEDSPLAHYASRVSQMGWRELNGYLRGFIDSVFYDGERYFLIDYKSTYLGVQQADYRPDRLLEPMIEHDYILQYLIYSIALDRHLSQRLIAYDYEKHFGGVYYLFLRGLATTHESGCGIFFDRPSKEMIRRTSALLGDVEKEAS
jgi:exodeoxyribonuclease V beta subunit